MKRYTSDQLDSKIHRFLARKLTQYPELRRSEVTEEVYQPKLRHPRQIIWTYRPA